MHRISYALSRLFDKAIILLGNAMTAFYSFIGRLPENIGVGITLEQIMAAIVVLEIWTVIAVMILSGGLLLDLQKKRSKPCFAALCIACALAVFEIILSVVCFPVVYVFSFVNILYLIYAVMALVHMRKRKGRFCRISAVVLIVIVVLNLLTGGFMFTKIAGIG